MRESLLPKRSVLVGCEAARNLRMIEVSVVSRSHGLSRFVRGHAGKGNSLRMTVAVLALDRVLDLLKGGAFVR